MSACSAMGRLAIKKLRDKSTMGVARDALRQALIDRQMKMARQIMQKRFRILQALARR